MPSAALPGPKGCAALLCFSIQSGMSAVFMQFIMQTRPISARALVLLAEVAVKLPVCVLLFAIECGGAVSMLRRLRHEAVESWVQMSAPALLYTVGATLQAFGAKQ